MTLGSDPGASLEARPFFKRFRMGLRLFTRRAYEEALRLGITLISLLPTRFEAGNVARLRSHAFAGPTNP
jgi:hypothetical protein